MSGRGQRRRGRRLELKPELNPLRSIPNLADLSDDQLIEYLFDHYPIRVVLDFVGMHRAGAADSSEAEARIIRAYTTDPKAVAIDLAHVVKAARRAALKQVDTASSERTSYENLSATEWFQYLRQRYPRRVVREFEGIEQTAAAASSGAPPATTKRAKSRHRIRPARGAPYARVTRYQVHLIFVAIVATLGSRNIAPIAAVAFLGLIVGLVALLSTDVIKSVVAFKVRGQSKNRRVEVQVRVETKSWRPNVPALLALGALFLPPEYREDYIEEHYANLLAADSWPERLSYLVDLLVEFPRFAWRLYRERKREAAK